MDIRRPGAIAIVVAVASVGTLVVVPPANAATVSTVVDGITYTADDANVGAGATVTDYDPSFGLAPTVPQTVTVDGAEYTVTTIGPAAFESNGLTGVALPATITLIDDFAFYANALTAIAIPDGVVTIGERAFDGNDLTNLVIPNSVTVLGNHAFQGNGLTSLSLGDSVTTVGAYAFSGNALTTVSIPESVTYLGEGAFLTNQLTSITLPDSLTEIRNYTFAENELASLTLPDSITWIWSYAFYDNSLTELHLPSNVEAIGFAAFSHNELTSVAIADGLASIGAEAFRQNHLTTVRIPASVTVFGENVFYDNDLGVVTFEGDAPEASGGAAPLGQPEGVLVQFFERNSGFTSPTWQFGLETYASAPLASVTFDTAGGSAPPVSQEVVLGSTATEPAAPTRDGYTFAGWSDGVALFDFATPIAEDTALTAQWAAPQIHVPNSATAGETITVTGSGFAPGDSVAIELHSEPVNLGTFAVDGTGGFTASVTIPADTLPGDHEIVAIASGSSFTAAIVITEAELAATGVDVLGLWIAGGLIALGLATTRRVRARAPR